MIRSYLTRSVCIGAILTVAVPILCTPTFSAAPAPNSNRMKIVGTWEITKSDDGTPVGTTLELAADGKLKLTIKAGDQTLHIEGTYKVEGNKLTLTIKPPNEKESTDIVTITKLTDKELITQDEKGKKDEFKKKK